MSEAEFAIPESVAAAIFTAAIESGRASETFEALLSGGSATVDSDGGLHLITASAVEQILARDIERARTDGITP